MKKEDYNQLKDLYQRLGQDSIIEMLQKIEIKEYLDKFIDDDETAAIGKYAFKGGHFSKDPEAYPDLLGVVCWKNEDLMAPVGSRGLIVTLEEETLQWSNKYYTKVLSTKDKGRENTQIIMNYAQQYNASFPAAEYCYRYNLHGVKEGEGFLGSEKEWRNIYDNKYIVNLALSYVNAPRLCSLFWTSTEANSIRAWSIYFGFEGYGDYLKIKESRVRCLLAF